MFSLLAALIVQSPPFAGAHGRDRCCCPDPRCCKVRIRDAVLFKPGKLTDDEFRETQLDPETEEIAQREMALVAGSQLDPEVVSAFFAWKAWPGPEVYPAPTGHLLAAGPSVA